MPKPEQASRQPKSLGMVALRLLIAAVGIVLVGHTLIAMLEARSQPTVLQTITNASFETGDLTGWTKVGDAFDFQPTLGDNPVFRDRESSGLAGKWWIGGYERYQGHPGQKPGEVHGDEPTGTLTCDPFIIHGEALDFLIGGGRYPWKPPIGENSLCANLIVEGQLVFTATGDNSETMFRQRWDVSEYRGRSAQIQLVDGHQGGWGHLNFDDVRQLTRWQMGKGDLLLFLWTGGMVLLIAIDRRG